VTRPRPPRKTARQRRSEEYALEWANNRQSVAKWKYGRILRGPEFVRALEFVRDATGDPVFDEALRAANEYGFDKELKRTARRVQGELFGDVETDYLFQVEFLHRRGKVEASGRRRRLKIREACEVVVAESGLPGSSFGTVVERLRKRFLASPPPRTSRPPDLESMLTKLTGRRIAEQTILVKKPRRKKTIHRS
jgi:hypothetical protein